MTGRLTTAQAFTGFCTNVLSIPLDGPPQAFLNIHDRFVAQVPLSSGNIGPRMFDVAGTRRLEIGIEGFVQLFADELQEIDQIQRAATGNVVNIS